MEIKSSSELVPGKLYKIEKRKEIKDNETYNFSARKINLINGEKINLCDYSAKLIGSDNLTGFFVFLKMEYGRKIIKIMGLSNVASYENAQKFFENYKIHEFKS